MNGPEPSAQLLALYAAALQRIADAVDTGRPVRFNGREASALEHVTQYKRARAQGTYNGPLDTPADSVYR